MIFGKAVLFRLELWGMALLRIPQKVGIHLLEVPRFVRKCEGICFPEIGILVFVLRRLVMEHLAGFSEILDLAAEHEAAYFTATFELGLLAIRGSSARNGFVFCHPCLPVFRDSA